MARNTRTLELSELAADLQTLRELPPIIHERGRLGIVSALAAGDSLTFTELRDVLNLTDGNLAAHLRPLQEAGYIETRKVDGETKPVTEVRLTATGRAAFGRYIDALEQVIRRSREPSPSTKESGPGSLPTNLL
jgi:DNA-binding MarR family transcriptional regulator